MKATLNTQATPETRIQQLSEKSKLSGPEINILFNQRSSTTFKFSATELWLLLDIAGVRALYGFSDPYASLPEDEQQVMKDKALQNLIQRECLQRVNENELVLQTTLATVLNACATPRYSLFICSQTVDGTFTRRIVYVTAKLVVDCIENLSGSYQLSALPTLSSFQELLYRVLDVSEDLQPASVMEQLQGILSQAHQKCIAGHADAGIAMLRSMGLTTVDANRLGMALSMPCSGMTITLIVHPINAEPYPKKSFVMWQTQSEIWLLQPYLKGAGTHFALKTIKSDGL